MIPSWYRADLLLVEIQQRNIKTADAHLKAALTCLFHFQTVYSTQLERVGTEINSEHIDPVNYSL